MNSHFDTPEPVLLIIADISGYTRYMTVNAMTLAHSQTIITELVKTILKQVELPLEVAKLEGDAVFLFCRKQNDAHPWTETKQAIGDKLLAFFRMFAEKLIELSRSNICICNACTHIDKLRLKVVVHSGEALFHHVLNFIELAGLDVIIVHRLLKNSVDADQYLLLTRAARHDVEFSEQIQFSDGLEAYDHIGQIKTLVYLPDGYPSAKAGLIENSLGQFGKSWSLFCKLWFVAFRSKLKFHHVTSDTNLVGRIGFATLMLLLAPIYFSVGALLVLFHVIRKDDSETGHLPTHMSSHHK